MNKSVVDKRLRDIIEEEYAHLVDFLGEEKVNKKYPNIKGNYNYYNYKWIVYVVNREKIKKSILEIIRSIRNYFTTE